MRWRVECRLDSITLLTVPPGVRTKDHRRRNFVVYVEVVYNELQKNLGNVPVILASAQTDMFAAEYRSDKKNSSGLHCRVIKIQHQTERLYLSRHSGTACRLYQNVYSGTIAPFDVGF